MTSERAQQTTAIYILTNISRSKGNQTVILGQVKNITREIFLFKNHAKNEAGRLHPDLFFVL